MVPDAYRGCSTEPAWMEACAFRPNEVGILTSTYGNAGLGAVLIVECSATGRFLMARKSFRAGYEMNDRLTFPGGMVRARGAITTTPSRLQSSPFTRA